MCKIIHIAFYNWGLNVDASFSPHYTHWPAWNAKKLCLLMKLNWAGCTWSNKIIEFFNTRDQDMSFPFSGILRQLDPPKNSLSNPVGQFPSRQWLKTLDCFHFEYSHHGLHGYSETKRENTEVFTRFKCFKLKSITTHTTHSFYKARNSHMISHNKQNKTWKAFCGQAFLRTILPKKENKMLWPSILSTTRKEDRTECSIIGSVTSHHSLPFRIF